MKKFTLTRKYHYLILALFFFTNFGFSQSDIIISQYIETSSGSTPKGIEIFNVSGADITFTPGNNLQIYQGTNGAVCANLPGTNITSGTLLANEVWVIGTSDLTTFATTNGTNLSGITTFAFGFNGDDALQLYLGGVLQDEFGTCGVDPGSSWSGSGVSTANNNLQVKDGLCNGDIVGWTDPSIRYDQIAGGTVMTGFGNAPVACSVSCPHTITSFTPASGPIGTNVTITGTGFTAGSTVNFNSTAAAVTFVNATTLTAIVPAGATTGVITVTEAGCDLDTLTDYTVTACTPTQTITSFAPATGPELTEVTIIGTGFTVGTTVEFNGVSATIISQTTTQLVVEVPVGATAGAIRVTEAGCPLDSATDFTVLLNLNCSGGVIPAGFVDLMMSGVYDDQTESCHYIELLNPTSADIDLSDYTIGLDNNFILGSAVPTAGFSGGTLVLSGIISAQSTFMIRVSNLASSCTGCSITSDLSFIGSAGFNDDDRLVLFNDVTVTALDVWQNHSNGAGYNVGYVFGRDNTATAPSTTFNNADWVLDGNEDCFGFAISTTPLPTVDTQPVDDTSCSNYAFSVTASAGNSGALTYQWKYNDGSASGWTDVLNTSFSPGVVLGETSNSLTITGFNLEGYQFYCEVTEGGSCSVVSNAAQVKINTATWNGSVWSTGSAPTTTDVAVIDGDYDTATYGSFSACQLFINSGNNLIVDNSTYVEIENDVTVFGQLLVETQGAFVQNNDSGNFTLDAGGASSVNKSTSTLNNWYDYTYWSSPVVDDTVGTGLDIAPADRRFWFNAANYLDVLMESGNNNTLVPGHDDIDDDGNDWQYANAASIMTPGVGYAATVSPTGFVVGSYQVNFEGEFNNGVITTPIAYNGANGDNDWNFIGNPYPGSIDSNTFFTANSAIIGGAAYLWSQNTPPSETSNGNGAANFAQADYAIITNSGVNTAGGDGIIPTDFIPSGQGFFVQGLANGNVTYNNSMRIADTSSNDQFFRTSATTDGKNVIWLNLTSDNGVFNQIAVAYVDGATNGNDGIAYDATRNLASGNAAIAYSIIDGDDQMFAIQGKDPSSLTNDEIVPIGLKTFIDIPTLYSFSIAQLEGQIITNVDIYLKDNLLGIEHDLNQSVYTFTSEEGEFNNRFEIIFREIPLSVDTPVLNELIIAENGNEELNFSTTHHSIISEIQVYNVLGQLVYNIGYKEEKTLVTLKTSALQNSILIANITLADGKVLTKKLIRQ